MRVVLNHPVRHLSLVLTGKEQRRYHDVAQEFLSRGVMVRSLGSGPQMRRDMSAIPDRYRITVLVDEPSADAFLLAITRPR